MTPAKKTYWGSKLIHAYTHSLYKKHFFSITIGGDGIDFFRDPFSSAICFSNHYYWWDGLLEVALMRGFHLDSYTMMEEKNLLAFPFFRHAGVFGVDLGKDSSRASALRYSVRLLKNQSANARRTLFLYPQGKISPPYHEEAEYSAGITSILRLSSDTQAIPVYKEIVPWKFPHPVVHFEIGKPIAHTPTLQTSHLSQAVSQLREKTQMRFANADWSDSYLYFQNKKDLARTPDTSDYPIHNIPTFQNEFKDLSTL